MLGTCQVDMEAHVLKFLLILFKALYCLVCFLLLIDFGQDNHIFFVIGPEQLP